MSWVNYIFNTLASRNWRFSDELRIILATPFPWDSTSPLAFKFTCCIFLLCFPLTNSSCHSLLAFSQLIYEENKKSIVHIIGDLIKYANLEIPIWIYMRETKSNVLYPQSNMSIVRQTAFPLDVLPLGIACPKRQNFSFF